MSDKKEKDQKRALQLGLVGTSPYYIDTLTLHQFPEEEYGYILYVIEEITINAASDIRYEGDSLDGKTLPPGLYHMPVKALRIDGGRLFVYRATEQY